MMRRIATTTTALVPALAVLCGAASAYGEANSNMLSLEEIIVTSERRAQNLQAVPVSVSAFTGSFIDDARIDSFTDISTRVPGLAFTSLTKSVTFPALRGAVSSIFSPGVDQSVAIFIDDVYLGGAGDFDPDLFDLERIEVLRGPQGTLFGRNVMGGVINVVTRKPGNEIRAALQGTVGDRSRLDIRGTASGPLVKDRLFASLSFSSRNRDGTAFNRTTGARVDDVNKDSVRARLTYAANDSLEFNLGADYTRDTSSVEARKFLGPAPTLPEFVAAGFMPNDDKNIVDQPAEASGDFDRKIYGVWGRINWDTEIGEVISITSYRRNDSSLPFSDLIGTPLHLLGISSDNDLEQFSQELRIVSPGDQRLTWVAGLYYLNVQTTESRVGHFMTIPGTLFHDFSVGAGFADPLTANTSITDRFQDNKTNSYAIYGQATYTLTETVSITAGGRYTYDKKSGSFELRDLTEPGNNPLNIFWSPEGFFSTPYEESWNAFTPRLTLDYKPNDDLMFYATLSKGFKSGGFTFQTSPIGSATPFNPENAWNYEAGIKSRWLEDRLQLNATLYHVDYKNLQIETTLPTGVTIISNAGKSDVTGLELEVQARPIQGLDIWGSYTYMDGRYLEFGGFTADPDNTSAMAFTPDHAFSVGASYTVLFPSGASLRLMGDWQYKDDYLLEPRLPGEEAPFLTNYNEQINASITYIFANANWEVSLWGKNLTNERYKAYGQDLNGMAYSEAQLFDSTSPDFIPGAAGATMPRFSPPRTWGLSLTWKLN